MAVFIGATSKRQKNIDSLLAEMSESKKKAIQADLKKEIQNIYRTSTWEGSKELTKSVAVKRIEKAFVRVFSKYGYKI
jgi:hypothetical protein